MGKDYIHSVLTCLEDALTDRDQVHRQTAASIVKHLALGTAGLGAEDANLHLLNLIWPNIFESASLCSSLLLFPRHAPELTSSLSAASPHVINSMLDAIEAMRVALGPGIVLQHVLQGLFHPARKVREVRLAPSSPSLFRPRADAVCRHAGVLVDLQLAVHGRAGRPRRLLPLARAVGRAQRLRARPPHDVHLSGFALSLSVVVSLSLCSTVTLELFPLPFSLASSPSRSRAALAASGRGHCAEQLRLRTEERREGGRREPEAAQRGSDEKKVTRM